MIKLTGKQIKYWYKKYIPETIRIFTRRLIPFWVEIRYFYFKTKKFNYEIQGHGEANKLLEICRELNISNGYYVDIGASDGWSSSATFLFAKNKNFSGHSLRSGFATSAAEFGADERSIMAMTGHKTTQMVRRYIREANIFKNNALNKIKI